VLPAKIELAVGYFDFCLFSTSEHTRTMAAVSREKENALRSAAADGYIHDVQALIKSGVNPNTADQVCCLTVAD